MTGLRTGEKSHADMHPLTRARVDAQAAAGRCLSEYVSTAVALGRGEVLPPYVERYKAAYQEALNRLVEAAQAGAPERRRRDRAEPTQGLEDRGEGPREPRGVPRH